MHAGYLKDALNQEVVWTGGLSAVLCLGASGVVVLPEVVPFGSAKALYEGGGVVSYNVAFLLVGEVGHALFVRVDIRGGGSGADYAVGSVLGVGEAFDAHGGDPFAAWGWALDTAQVCVWWSIWVSGSASISECLVEHRSVW